MKLGMCVASGAPQGVKFSCQNILEVELGCWSSPGVGSTREVYEHGRKSPPNHMSWPK